MAGGDAERPLITQGELLRESAELERMRGEWGRKYRDAVDDRERLLTRELSEAVGVDLRELAERVANADGKRFEALRRERDALVRRASDLAGREGEALRAARKAALQEDGLARLVDRYFHNPRLTSKTCTDWETATGSDESTSRCITEVDDTIAVNPGSDPVPDSVAMSHPFVRADVDGSYYGHASAWVRQTLHYHRSAPDHQTLVYNVGILFDAHGVGSAWSSDFASPSMTRAAAAGGDAALDLSIQVSQQITRPDGSSDTLVHDVVCYHELARFRARGGIHWFTGRLGSHAWGGVSMNSERRDFTAHHLIPLYGTTVPDETQGGGITITVEFLSWADADYYHADAEIGFRGPGHGIEVLEVYMDGLTLDWD